MLLMMRKAGSWLALAGLLGAPGIGSMVGCAAMSAEMGSGSYTRSAPATGGAPAQTLATSPAIQVHPPPPAELPASIPIHEEQVVVSQVLPGTSAGGDSLTRVISQSAGTPSTPHQAAPSHPDEHGASPAGAASHSAHWSYSGEGGPAKWGSLSQANALCKRGRNQSPIDIPAQQLIRSDSLVLTYTPIPLKVLNNGHTIQVNNSSAASMVVDGERFDLAQFHFHSPSEHTVQGRAYPLEMHLVHKSAGGELAVVGILFELGAENPILQAIWSNLPNTVNEVNDRSNIQLDVRSMISLNAGFVRYDGSLTTPPCSEGVRWIVINQPNFVSQAQVTAFLSVISPNARPTQFLLGRKVYRSP